MGTCVYHVAHQGLGGWVKRIGRNAEMPNFTQALYDARELAMERMQTEAESLAGGGHRRRPARRGKPRLGQPRDRVLRDRDRGHADERRAHRSRLRASSSTSTTPSRTTCRASSPLPSCLSHRTRRRWRAHDMLHPWSFGSLVRGDERAGAERAGRCCRSSRLTRGPDRPRAPERPRWRALVFER